MSSTASTTAPMLRAPWRPAPPRAALPAASVLLASTGRPFTDAAIAEAVRLAGGPRTARVRVITVARIHGSSFGLQHPGLMPNKKEKDAARAVVTQAIKSLQRSGLKADGEVVITRSPARSFARAARAAGASHVVLDNPPAGRLSRLDVGATARYLRFRLGDVALAVI
jgi:nucleotide-binding universal stress UspA family protein